MWPAWIAVTVGFFLLRFFGQGVLQMSSRNMVLKWFDRRRGLVTALMGVGTTLGFSYAPIVFDALIRRSSWRAAWAAIGLAVLGFAALAALLYRDNPAACNLRPDGPVRVRPAESGPPPRPFPGLRRVGATTAESRTLEEASRTLSCWVVVLVLALAST